MEIEAVAAPEGSVCAKHPQRAGLFVCSRCGDYACEHCVTPRRGEALCRECGAAPEKLPAELGARMQFLYLSVDGRISRKTWWLFLSLPSLAIQGVLLFLPLMVGAEPLSTSIVIALVGLLLTWPALAMSIKRLHDRNLSGWWLLMSYVPLIGPIWFLVAMGFLAGDVELNRYGPPPA